MVDGEFVGGLTVSARIGAMSAGQHQKENRYARDV